MDGKLEIQSLMGEALIFGRSGHFRACTTRGLLELPNLNGHPSKNGWLCGPCSQRLDSIHLQSFDALVSLQIHSNIRRFGPFGPNFVRHLNHGKTLLGQVDGLLSDMMLSQKLENQSRRETVEKPGAGWGGT